MIHTIQRIDASSFEQQYQDIIRLYLNPQNTSHPNGNMNSKMNDNDNANEKEIMVIDLSKLEHINSLVLTFLLALKRWSIARQIPYQFAQMPKHLEGLANVYGIAELLDINTFQAS